MVVGPVATGAAAAAVGLFLFNLVGLKVLGRTSGGERNRGNGETGLEPGVTVGRLAVVAPAGLVGAVGSGEGLGTEGAEGCTGEDLAAAVLGEVAVLIALALKEGGDAGAGEGALGKVPFVVVGSLAATAGATVAAVATATRAGAAAAAVGDVVVFVLAVVLFATTVVVAGHGPVTVAGVRIAAVGIPRVSTVVGIAAPGSDGAGADLATLMSVVVVVLVVAAADDFAVDIAFPHDHGAGLGAVISVVEERLRRGRLLDDDLLGLGSLLADDDRGRRRVGGAVVLGLLAVALDVVAAGVVIGLFDAALDADIVGAGGAAVPVAAVRLSGLSGLDDGASALGGVKVGAGTVALEKIVGHTAAAGAGEAGAGVVLDLDAVKGAALGGTADLVASDGGGTDGAVVVVFLAVGPGRPVCVAHGGWWWWWWRGSACTVGCGVCVVRGVWCVKCAMWKKASEGENEKKGMQARRCKKNKKEMRRMCGIIKSGWAVQPAGERTMAMEDGDALVVDACQAR